MTHSINSNNQLHYHDLSSLENDQIASKNEVIDPKVAKELFDSISARQQELKRTLNRVIAGSMVLSKEKQRLLRFEIQENAQMFQEIGKLYVSFDREVNNQFEKCENNATSQLEVYNSIDEKSLRESNRQRKVTKLHLASSEKVDQIGLPNFGQTCWLNATLQMIFNIPGLRERLESKVDLLPRLEHESLTDFQRRLNEYNDPNNQQIRLALRNLYQHYKAENQKLKKENAAPAPKPGILEKIYNICSSYFYSNPMSDPLQKYLLHLSENIDAVRENIYAQHDSSELLSLILPALGVSIEMKDNIAGVDRLVHSDSHLMLALPPHKDEMQDAVDNYFEFETVKSYGQLVKKGIQLTDKLPETLVLQLKRYVSDDYGRIQKINRRIQFSKDFVVDLSAGYENSNPDQVQKSRYELEGFIVHIGRSTRSGHYISYYRKDDQWFCADDLRVRQVDESEVRKQSELAYIYFFKREN